MAFRRVLVEGKRLHNGAQAGVESANWSETIQRATLWKGLNDPVLLFTTERMRHNVSNENEGDGGLQSDSGTWRSTAEAVIAS